jgi:XTP/dITP diphosphohydrolase
MEELALHDNLSLADMSLEEMDVLWEKAKLINNN